MLRLRVPNRISARVVVILLALAPLLIAAVVGSANRDGAPGRLASGQAGAPFSASPSQGAALTRVSTSGTGCTGQDPKVQVWLAHEPQAPDETGIFNTTGSEGTSIDGTGVWSVPLTITPRASAGSYAINARCFADSASTGFFYASQPFEVLPGPEASWSVSPLIAEADAEVTFTVTGTACLGLNARGSVYVTAVSEFDHNPLLVTPAR